MTIVISKPIRVEIPKIIFDRSDWVKYLIVLDWQRRLADVETFEAVTSEKFNNFVHKQIKSYVLEKKAPPKEIATAIMNIADDLLSGREPVLRAGDYFQLQEFMRG
ncbi:MAG: hypothetical protein ACFFCW_07190 [Candidatus Hodarchaeota archaeon]